MKNSITGFVLLLSATFLGCSDWLNIEPNDRQTEAQLFATKDGFYSSLNGIYTTLGSSALYGKNLSYEMIEILGKRYAFTAENSYLAGLNAYNYADDKVAGQMQATWNAAYKAILNCNVVLKNMEEKKGTILNEREYRMMKGELLAVRAYLHFDMLRMFGPVYKNKPSALSIPYNESHIAMILPLLPADSVANSKILRDLNESEGLLLLSDPVIAGGAMANTLEDNPDNAMRYRQLRFNYYAVLLLKARVLLYIGDRSNALLAAKKLIKDPQVPVHFPSVDASKLLANNMTPDRMFSTEVLFGRYDKSRSLIYTDHFLGDNAGNNLLQPRAGFVDGSLFSGETQDYRFQSQWAVSTAVGTSGHMFVKFKGITDPDFKLFYGTFIAVLRLSEAYYIAAEAAEDLGESYDYLNVIRQARGVPTLSGTRAQLETQLRSEYLREFYGEGQSFFMYKRLSISIPGKENGFNTSTYGGTEARFVIPLPKSELENR